MKSQINTFWCKYNTTFVIYEIWQTEKHFLFIFLRSGRHNTLQFTNLFHKNNDIMQFASWRIWRYHFFFVPLHSMMGYSTAGGSSSGVHWKQFIAECGIEYSCQIVTQIFINPQDCLYTKKSCEFLQSYEKSSAKQKN